MDRRKPYITCSKVEGGAFDKKLKSKSLKRLFMADYSSLASLPIIPGRAFYAPQVIQYDAVSDVVEYNVISCIQVAKIT